MLLQDPNILKLAITAFRGSAKSTIATLAYIIWSMIGAPQKKYILVVSQTQELAKQILANIKAEFEENELLIHDFGPFTEVADEWRSNSIVNSQYSCRISAVSQSEGVRGLRHRQYRPDLIIVDDVEDLEAVKTKEGRDKLWNWLTGEVIPLGEANTKIVLVGNLLHEDSLMMRIKQHIAENKMAGVYREYPLLDVNNKILWPGLYPDRRAIEVKRRSIADEAAWHREYLLKIIADEDRVVHKDWIRYYDELPNILEKPPRLIAIGVDLAISGKATADFTTFVPAYITGYGKDLMVYILPQITNKRLTFPQTIEGIEKLCNQLHLQFKREAVSYVEGTAYQASVSQQLTVKKMFSEPVNVSGYDKRSRLNITTPYIKAGKVLFPKKWGRGVN